MGRSCLRTPFRITNANDTRNQRSARPHRCSFLLDLCNDNDLNDTRHGRGARAMSPLLGLAAAENSKGVIRSYFPDLIWAWNIAQ